MRRRCGNLGFIRPCLLPPEAGRSGSHPVSASSSGPPPLKPRAAELSRHRRTTGPRLKRTPRSAITLTGAPRDRPGGVPRPHMGRLNARGAHPARQRRPSAWRRVEAAEPLNEPLSGALPHGSGKARDAVPVASIQRVLGDEAVRLVLTTGLDGQAGGLHRLASARPGRRRTRSGERLDRLAVSSFSICCGSQPLGEAAAISKWKSPSGSSPSAAAPTAASGRWWRNARTGADSRRGRSTPRCGRRDAGARVGAIRASARVWAL